MTSSKADEGEKDERASGPGASGRGKPNDLGGVDSEQTVSSPGPVEVYGQPVVVVPVSTTQTAYQRSAHQTAQLIVDDYLKGGRPDLLVDAIEEALILAAPAPTVEQQPEAIWAEGEHRLVSFGRNRSGIDSGELDFSIASLRVHQLSDKDKAELARLMRRAADIVSPATSRCPGCGYPWSEHVFGEQGSSVCAPKESPAAEQPSIERQHALAEAYASDYMANATNINDTRYRAAKSGFLAGLRTRPDRDPSK
jgi:hypothetical protein